MEKSYRANLVGLFGDPVDENPTGVMMEAGFQNQNLNYRYMTLQVKKGHLEEAMAAMRTFHMDGINLTIPHKVDVIPLLDELSPAASMIGAVNSVRNQDGRLIGENTDGKGFVTSLMEENIVLSGKTLTILGAGGAAKAVAVECALSGAKKIIVINRNEKRGRALSDLVAEKTAARSVYLPWKGTVSLPKETEILVNCTNIGLFPDVGLPDIDYSGIQNTMVVCDVVFNPPDTPFLKEAAKRGAHTVNGLGMLVNQGALNYSLWTLRSAPKEVMTQALYKEFGLEYGVQTPKSLSHEENDRNLIEKMVAYYAGDPRRIQHFLKVYEFAKLIGESEKLSEEQQHILRTAAIVHDIGIKNSEKKYGKSTGKYQEMEGPAVAEPMLLSCGYREEVIDRVLYLIAHHHTYREIDGLDYQILVEADFLVNLYEDQSSVEVAKNVQNRIFKTKTGLWYLEQLFL